MRRGSVLNGLPGGPNGDMWVRLLARPRRVRWIPAQHPETGRPLPNITRPPEEEEEREQEEDSRDEVDGREQDDEAEDN